jgi:hypothetical protein
MSYRTHPSPHPALHRGIRNGLLIALPFWIALAVWTL